MADTVTDKFRYVADKLRSLRAPTVFGVEQVQLQIVTRSWYGGARGADGGYTESVVTLPNYYKIVEVDPEELPDSGGRFETEFVRVGPITPNFTVGSTSGGFTRSQLAPSGVKGVEIIYRLTGSLTGDFKREHIETYRGFQYNLVLSRSRTSTGQTGGSDSQISTLPGLFLWYRDTASASIWSDLSGNGGHALQSNPALQAGTTATGINGLPSVVFSAVNGVSSSYYLLPSLATLTAAEVFIVPKSNTDGAGATTVGFATLGTSGQPTRYRNTDGHIYDDFGSTTQHVTTSGEPNVSLPHLYNAISTPTEWSLSVDGTQLFTTATNTVQFPSQPVVGCSLPSSTNAGFAGQWSDFLLFTGKLSNANRSIVKSYIATRYQIAIT